MGNGRMFLAARAASVLTVVPVAALGTSQPAVKRTLRGLLPDVTRPRRATKHTPSSTAEVNTLRYTATLHTPLWPCV